MGDDRKIWQLSPESSKDIEGAIEMMRADGFTYSDCGNFLLKASSYVDFLYDFFLTWSPSIQVLIDEGARPDDVLVLVDDEQCDD